MLQLHLAVILFGLSGIFGKLLLLPAVVIVGGRTFFAAAALAVSLRVGKVSHPHAPLSDLLVLVLAGPILAIHWIAFFQSIQLSTVAVGLLSFSTFPIFVTFLEPFWFAGRLKLWDVIASVVVFLGLALVVPEFSWQNNVTLGVVVGVISGATFAILVVINRAMTLKYPPVSVAFSQNLIAFLSILPWLENAAPFTGRDLLLLAVLGILCTALAHTLFISSLRVVRAQVAAMVTALEPVYGILFAFLIFGEVPTLRMLLGGLIIVTTATAVAVRSAR